MRFFCLLGFIAACMPLSANGAEKITPGMGLDAVKRTLHRHGYEVDEKYRLAMETAKGNALEFCRIDDDVTLILNYDRRTNEVRSLGLIFFPEDRTSKGNVLDRQALEMQFEDDGVYTMKMRRKVDPEKRDK